jgi:hypothetical protein
MSSGQVRPSGQVIFVFFKKFKIFKKIPSFDFFVLFHFLIFSFLSNTSRTMTFRSVTHPQIATSPARLTPKFYLNKLPLHYQVLIDISSIPILLSHVCLYDCVQVCMCICLYVCRYI